MIFLPASSSTASVGTSSAEWLPPICRFTDANMPGLSKPPGLGTTQRTRAVRDFASRSWAMRLTRP